MAAEEKKHDYDFDFFVIGGGSGGLAAVKEAAKFGAKCAVADFVKPSPAGTTWGLGGTCLNVGCIPKKLMHMGALMGDDIKRTSRSYGWNVDGAITHDWSALVDNVRAYIKKSNFGHKGECKEAGIEYFNELASFVDPHTVECVNKKGKVTRRTAQTFLVSVGGRPNYGPAEGAKECCISSDDIFSLDHDPGKTLVVGASYIALECAGFLFAYGYDVSVMVRSILLRGFDRHIAKLIGEYMEYEGIEFIREQVPKKFEKTESGKVKVTWGKEGEKTEEFDTVLLAIGRKPDLAGVNLQAAGVEVSERSGKILTKNEQTNVSHIYAIGDCIDGVPELTPSAIQAGRFLARRLYNNSSVLMDYKNIATTVFTPLEYGVIGLSEEDAVERYTMDKLEIFHTHWKPLRWNIDMSKQGTPMPYAKLVCLKDEDLRVVGFHYLGPDAGEVTQGFSAAIRLGLRYQDLVETVGIHPTEAEQCVGLIITKSSGLPPLPPGC